MSFLSLVFGLGGAQTSIGALQLDALLTESTELNSNISEYPVEEGPPITDHITQNSERLALSGVVTGAGVLMFGAGGRSKLMAAKEALRLIHEGRIPITVITGMDIYENFGMSNARIGRSNQGDKLTIECEFQKIRKVTAKQADIPPEKVAESTDAQGNPQGKGAGAKGKAGATGAKGGKASTASQQQAPSDLSKLTSIK